MGKRLGNEKSLPVHRKEAPEGGETAAQQVYDGVRVRTYTACLRTQRVFYIKPMDSSMWPLTGLVTVKLGPLAIPAIYLFIPTWGMTLDVGPTSALLVSRMPTGGRVLASELSRTPRLWTHPELRVGPLRTHEGCFLQKIGAERNRLG